LSSSQSFLNLILIALLKAENQTTQEKATDATPPFGSAQGHESFDLVQDRELVERPVEWQMDF
jgi:hypothetical protein